MVSFAKPKSVSLRTAFFSLLVYSRFSGWRWKQQRKTSEQAFTKLPRHDITCFTIWALNFISAYLDVSVRDINVVEKIDGRADVPHNL